jgi:hypothetical protein
MQLKMKMARWWRARWWLTAEAHRLATRRLCSLDHDTATFQLNTLQPAQPGGLAIHAPAGCSQLTNHITHNDALVLGHQLRLLLPYTDGSSLMQDSSTCTDWRAVQDARCTLRNVRKGSAGSA